MKFNRILLVPYWFIPISRNSLKKTKLLVTLVFVYIFSVWLSSLSHAPAFDRGLVLPLGVSYYEEQNNLKVAWKAYTDEDLTSHRERVEWNNDKDLYW